MNSNKVTVYSVGLLSAYFFATEIRVIVKNFFSFIYECAINQIEINVCEKPKVTLRTKAGVIS